MIKISISLEDYVRALIGPRSYGIIDDIVAANIRSVENHELVCIVENSSGAMDITMAELGTLSNGLSRVWLRSTWDIYANRAKEAAKKRAEEKQIHETLCLAAAGLMSAALKGALSPEQCLLSIRAMPREKVAEYCKANNVTLVTMNAITTENA